MSLFFPDQWNLNGVPDYDKLADEAIQWAIKQGIDSFGIRVAFKGLPPSPEYQKAIDDLQVSRYLVKKKLKKSASYIKKLDKALGRLLKDHEQIKRDDIKFSLANAIGKDLTKKIKEDKKKKEKEDKKKKKEKEERKKGVTLRLNRTLVRLIFRAKLEIPKMLTDVKEFKKVFMDLFIKTGRKPYPLKDPDDDLKYDLKKCLDEIIEQFKRLYKVKTKDLIRTKSLERIYDELVYAYDKCMFFYYYFF